MIRLFRVVVPTSTLILLCFETVVIIGSFIAASNLLMNSNLLTLLGFTEPIVYPDPATIAVVWVNILVGVYFQGLYTQVRVRSRLTLAQQLLLAVGLAFLMQAVISSINPDLSIPLAVMLLGCFFSMILIFAGRLLFNSSILQNISAERWLLMGESPLMDDITRYLDERPQLGIQVAAHIALPDPSRNLEEQIQPYGSRQIVVGTTDMLNPRLATELLDLRFLGYSIQDAAGTYARICNREGL